MSHHNSSSDESSHDEKSTTPAAQSRNQLRRSRRISQKAQSYFGDAQDEPGDNFGQDESSEGDNYRYSKADIGSDSNASSSGSNDQSDDDDDDDDDDNSGDEWMSQENLLNQPKRQKKDYQLYGYNQDSGRFSTYSEQSYDQSSIYQDGDDQSLRYHETHDLDLGEDNLPRDINRRMKVLFASDEGSSENESDANLDDLDDDDKYEMSSEEEEMQQRLIKKRKIQEQRSTQLSSISEDGRIFLSLAQKEYEAGHHNDAILLIEEAIVADPNSRLPYILLDVVHSDLGNESAALKAKIAAAIAGSVSADDWADVAQRSMTSGFYHQAIAFYIRAIQLDPEEPTYRMNLAQAYVEIGSLQRAVNAARNLHNIYPANPKYTSILAKLYLENGQVEEGIALYEDILIDNFKSASLDTSRVQPFGWSELNLLCELYDCHGAWVEGISTIKKVARWLLDRSNETWWADVPNDSEFDERRASVRKFKHSRYANDDSKFELPLDIRCKLLIFRLELEDYDEAVIHTKFLLDSDVNTYFDLFWDASSRYIKHRKYSVAHTLLLRLMEGQIPPLQDILQALGKCEMELGKWENAKQRFLDVLEIDEKNFEALVALGEICYALDDVPMATVYLDKIHKIMEEQRNKSETEDSVEPVTQDSAFIQSIRKPRKTNVMNPREREKLRKQLKEEITKDYKNLRHYWSFALENKHNIAAIIQWKQIAYRLVEQVLSMKTFTYGKKVHLMLRKNQGVENGLQDRYSMLTSKIIQNEIDQDVGEEMDYDQEDGATKSLETSRPLKRLEDMEIYGLTVENWRSVFMQLALVLAEFNDPVDAYQVLMAVKGIKIIRDGPGDRILNLVHISCAYLANDPTVAADISRYFSGKHEWVNDIYRFFYATIGTSLKSFDTFRMQSIQKYYFRRARHLKAHASKGKPLSAIPFSILGFSYVVNRTYSNALEQLHFAEKIAPRDPVILLGIAVSNILRAMNRLSSNRHVQVLQGFSYIMKYGECRREQGESYLKKKQAESRLQEQDEMDVDSAATTTSQNPNQDLTNWEEQETYYNTGRAFHSLGLMTEASTWYEKALDRFPDVIGDEKYRENQHASMKDEVKVDPENATYTLKPNTAYNLIQLYSTSGNLKLAREIADKYLVI